VCEREREGEREGERERESVSVPVFVFDALGFNAIDLVRGHKTRIIKRHTVSVCGTTLKFANNKKSVLCPGNFKV
jgi:hypothetical protein